MAAIAEKLGILRRDLEQAARRAGRSPDQVRLIAVTKTVGLDELRQAVNLGLRDFGENRLQDARPKIMHFPGVCWHFIGRLQTNKVKELLRHFSLLHSLDRYNLAVALQQRAEEMGKEVTVLIQVNVSGETSKSGLAPEELADFFCALNDLPRIKPIGLMTMAPLLDNPGEARPYFRRLRELKEKHTGKDGKVLSELSMGMSNDFKVAIEEGATMVRIGSALFG